LDNQTNSNGAVTTRVGVHGGGDLGEGWSELQRRGRKVAPKFMLVFGRLDRLTRLDLNPVFARENGGHQKFHQR